MSELENESGQSLDSTETGNHSADSITSDRTPTELNKIKKLDQKSLRPYLEKVLGAEFFKTKIQKVTKINTKKPKRNFTSAEDDIIVEGVNKFGKNWLAISETLDQRTPVQVRDRYRRLQKQDNLVANTVNSVLEDENNSSDSNEQNQKTEVTKNNTTTCNPSSSHNDSNIMKTPTRSKRRMEDSPSYVSKKSKLSDNIDGWLKSKVIEVDIENYEKEAVEVSNRTKQSEINSNNNMHHETNEIPSNNKSETSNYSNNITTATNNNSKNYSIIAGNNNSDNKQNEISANSTSKLDSPHKQNLIDKINSHHSKNSKNEDKNVEINQKSQQHYNSESKLRSEYSKKELIEALGSFYMDYDSLKLGYEILEKNLNQARKELNENEKREIQYKEVFRNEITRILRNYQSAARIEARKALTEKIAHLGIHAGTSVPGHEYYQLEYRARCLDSDREALDQSKKQLSRKKIQVEKQSAEIEKQIIDMEKQLAEMERILAHDSNASISGTDLKKNLQSSSVSSYEPSVDPENNSYSTINNSNSTSGTNNTVNLLNSSKNFEELESWKNEIYRLNQRHDLLSDELEQICVLEQIHRQRLNTLRISESELAHAKENLDQKISLHLKELRRIQEEDSSKWNSFPILKQRYMLLYMLGKGGFSEVYRAYDLFELHDVACKIHQLSRHWSTEKKANYVRHANRECEIHQTLNHPRVVKLYDYFLVDKDTFCTVMQFCDGGDLDSHLKQQKTLSENESRIIMSQIVQGLKYIASHKIIHYDLKPANILFDHDGSIKITDFGLSKKMDPDSDQIELTSQGAGTYWYLPPECFAKENPQISSKVDIWSVGVILYQMLFGCKPFANGYSQKGILEHNLIHPNLELDFPEKQSKKISDEAKNFLQQCLKPSEEKRPDVTALCNDPWLNFGSKKSFSRTTSILTGITSTNTSLMKEQPHSNINWATIAPCGLLISGGTIKSK